MNDEEIRSTIEQIKAQVKANPEHKDKSDDEIDELILDAFFKAYTEGEMTKEDLLGLAEVMGYEADEAFLNDPEAPEQIGEGEKPEGEPEANPEEAPSEDKGEGAEQSDLEEVRTMEPGESKEEFQDKIEDVKEGNPIEEKKESEEEPKAEEDDEESERKAASELWKMDLSKK